MSKLKILFESLFLRFFFKRKSCTGGVEVGDVVNEVAEVRGSKELIGNERKKVMNHLMNRRRRRRRRVTVFRGKKRKEVSLADGDIA